MLIDRKRILLILSILFLQISSLSSQIKVGLFIAEKPHSILFQATNGDYQIIINDVVLNVIKQGDFALVSRAGDKLALNYSKEAGVLVDSLEFIPLDKGNYFLLRDILNNDNGNNYDGRLIIKNDMRSLLVINQLNMEKYVAGVVQAEGGYKGHIEYFKTQAVIARTYAFLHLDKHVADAYNVCDNTHCQVYHGRSIVEKIDEAVRITASLVISDNDSLLALTPFHSNCGGETESSGDVWLTSIPHLLKITDPYCNYSRNATWTKEIEMEEWIEYLREHGFEGTKEDIGPFIQYVRSKDYSVKDFSYPLNRIRIDWGLRSTFFSLKPDADKVTFSGRGYGHGVGLCQEGAMVMADRGFVMKQIIDFYYNGVKIIDFKNVKIAETINTSF